MVRRPKRNVEVIDMTPVVDRIDDGTSTQGDLFRAELANLPIKDDVASMEVPMFSLGKNPDYDIREYRRGNRYLRVFPSAVGAATMQDKDLLLYIASHYTETFNRQNDESARAAVPRTVEIDTTRFLQDTARGDGSGSYERILDMLRRLDGTRYETNIPSAGFVSTEGFGAIEGYKVLSETKSTVMKLNKATGLREPTEVTRVISFRVTLSEWMYNGLRNFQVLTLDPGYYRLSGGIERRLYEIARKHVGDQALFVIDIDLLAQKVGTRAPRYKFRDELRAQIEADRLPDYRIALDPKAKPDDVVFYTRDGNKLGKHLATFQKNGVAGNAWYLALERSDNVKTWRAKKKGPTGDHG